MARSGTAVRLRYAPRTSQNPWKHWLGTAVRPGTAQIPPPGGKGETFVARLCRTLCRAAIGLPSSAVCPLSHCEDTNPGHAAALGTANSHFGTALGRLETQETLAIIGLGRRDGWDGGWGGMPSPHRGTGHQTALFLDTDSYYDSHFRPSLRS